MTLQNAFGNLALDATLTSETSLANSFTASGNTASLALGNRDTLGIQVVGGSPGTIVVEGTIDGTNWVTLTGLQILNLATLVWTSSITAAGTYAVGMAGYVSARVRMSVTGTATVSLSATQASNSFAIDSALPAGTNTIGSVKITDGTNSPAVKGSSATAIAGDSSLVVAISPNSPLPPGSNTIGQVTLAGGTNNGVGNVGHASAGTVTGNITAAAGTIDGTTDLTNYSALRLQITGTWVGTIAFQVSVDGTNWFTKSLNSSDGSTDTFTQANSLYFGPIGARYFRVLATSWTSGTAAVVIAYTAADEMSSSFTLSSPSAPNGAPTVDVGVSTQLYEGFDQALATEWTTTGTTGVAPTQANGLVTFSSALTVSVSSLLASRDPLFLPAGGYLVFGFTVKLDTNAALANNSRWWGYGNQSGPTAASPLGSTGSGAIFLLDYVAGAFYAATFSAGTRTNAVPISKPTDGALHKYVIYYSASRAYFLIDDVLVASISQPALAASNQLVVNMGSANFSSAPASAPTFVVSSAWAGNTGSGGQTVLTDGLSPSHRATVKQASTPAAITDFPLVVALHPSSPMIPGTAATNLGKAAGLATTTSDVGIAPLFVRAPTTPAAMTATVGRYTQSLADAEGKQIVQQYADPSNTWQAALTLTSTTASAASAAQAAGIRNYCTGLSLSNSAATATLVQILDGATVIWQAQLAASQAAFFVAFETPLRGTAATALNVKLGTAVTSVYASLQGFIGV